MVKVQEELKRIYFNNGLPGVEPVKMQLEIMVKGAGAIPQSKIIPATFELEESICTEAELTFGGCEAARISITLLEPGELKGKEITLTHIVGAYRMPLGTYVVDTCKKVDDYGLIQITAYDAIHCKLDRDVTDWYKSLSFPLSLKTFRLSLLSYTGIEAETQDLINDGMQVEKTIEPETLNGIEVARAIGEINGRFGHMSRDNKFRFVKLGGYGLYPSTDLYPEETLYPSGPGERFEAASYIDTVYEDYTAERIDCLKIRQEEGDVGCVVYDTRNFKNPYIITGNFLAYGKGAAELETIARKLFDDIKDNYYRPHTTTTIGLPYLEPGDSIYIHKKTDEIESYILSRKLTGVQAMFDTLEARGPEYRGNEVTSNDEIIMLKSKTLVINKSVDGLTVTVSDLEKNTESKFEQTANRITAEVKRATDSENALFSKIEITAESIKTEVADTANGLSSKIEQTASAIRTEVTNSVSGLSSKIEQTERSITARINGLDGDFSSLELYVDRMESTISDIDGNMSKLTQTVDSFTFHSSGGTVKISGDTIETGTLKSVSVVFDTHNAVYWVAGGSSITDTRGADWVCDSNALWTGNRNIQLYTNGDIHGEGTAYFGEIEITSRKSYWQGWNLTDTLEDLSERVKALERG